MALRLAALFSSSVTAQLDHAPPRTSSALNCESVYRAAARLGLVTPVALILIAFILFLTFRSIKQTLIALWITGEFLTVPTSVGFIALLGIAVLNGVAPMLHFNHLLAKAQVVREGALRRLRPVMMTATICAFGLVPLLLATGPGSEIQKSLAIVVIGGLISSRLLTLFLLSIIYQYFHRGLSEDHAL
ncbi:MAG: efflux RND transporter permease subunit [Gammaproteobacteria bacterium]|nr:efflux RND transporter permease subunit [Gammaproteobacteria bacterium]MBL4890357.1 efflux RND transporter permease subunit [Rhizobiaceae bacterium]